MTSNTESSAGTQDYYTWVADMADKWAQHAQSMAHKLQHGNYAAADVAADFSQCVALAIESTSNYVTMVSEFLSSFTTAPTASGSVTSETFSASTPGTAERSLTMSSSLIHPKGGTIPDAAVTFTPSVLAAGSTDFKFVVQTAGLAGGGYTGTVSTVPPPGSTDAAEDIAVWIQIP